MKKASFIVGLIAGIAGILTGITLLVFGLNMQVTNKDSKVILIIGVVGLLIQISGLVGACIQDIKHKVVTFVLMLISGIISIPMALYSISADSPISFILGLVVAIMFIVASVLRVLSK